MSIVLMTLAFKSTLPTTPKFVLVALCDSANDQGECYPSVTSLMEKCSLSDRGVQKAITELEQCGYLRREFRSGRSTIYWMTPERGSPRTTFTPNDVHPTPEPCSPPPPNVVHPTPERRSPITVIEPSVEPSGKQRKARAPASLPELEGIDEQVVADWKALRIAKRAPVTSTAIAGIRREADKAGMTLQQALEMSCERGWAGFKAEWLQDRGGGNSGGGKQGALEARNRAVIEQFKGAI